MQPTSPNMARAELLMSQGRYDIAEEHVRLALSEDPDNPLPHAWLALCFSRREQFSPATDEARRAVGLEPSEPFYHYILASIFNSRGMPKESEEAVRQALELDPSESSYWGLLASLKLQAKKYKESLEAAERGLECDAEDGTCLNVRAMAQQGLGLKADAERTIEGALRRRPDDPITHANMGWSLLHQSQPARAMEHFREALRLEPGMEWARTGIVEAMKARFFVYRWILAYFLWMQRLPSNLQWGLVLGALVASRIVRALGKTYPAAEPYLGVLLILYFVFCATTWLAVPLFNLILRLDRFGRLVLSKSESFAANMLGLALIPAIVSAVGWGVQGGTWEERFFITAPACIPVALAATCREGLPRRLMWGIAAIVVVWAGWMLAMTLSPGPLTLPYFSVYAMVCFFSPLLSNLLNTLTPRAKA